MNWKDAVAASPRSFGVYLVQHGKGVRLINSAGEVFRIDSQAGWPAPMEMTEKQKALHDWEPLTNPLDRWRRFDELMLMADVANQEPIRGPEETYPATATMCNLHAGQRGLTAMAREWNERLAAMKGLHSDLQGLVGFNEETPNLLDEMIQHLTKMREML